MNYFKSTAVNIVGNAKLRNPQVEAYLKIENYFKTTPNGEALVVLPTGTGKSGLISIAPFGVSNGRVLIVTPGLVTKDSIRKTQEVLEDNFWINFDILFDPISLPIINTYSSEISETHLKTSHFLISNIQQTSSMLDRLPSNFFDMIIVDESHHAPANSWQNLLSHFDSAKVLHVTGTPHRGDGQVVPGEKIHETSLSEVMRDRYVKWLRKETVNAHELYFTIAESPNIKLSKEQVLEFKEKEWIEKSVALSKECSLDVITHSVGKYEELKHASPTVPHKILAVGCSIKHAEDLYKWYLEQGLKPVIVHSNMSKDALKTAFDKIDSHNCDVVVSVNMLMEGYDHKYLSVLAIFRPYRSLNAFAQVVGRVLRAIPEDEITAFEVDNNAVVIYHEETGLDVMWESFQKEVDRAQKKIVKEYNISDAEYERSKTELAGISSTDTFISDQGSYIDDIDFNKLFEEKRAEIAEKVAKKMNGMSGQDGLDDSDLDVIKEALTKKETNKATSELIDPILLEKRPDQARKKLRELLTQKAQNEASSLLADTAKAEQDTELSIFFSSHVRNVIANKTSNAATLVMFINDKLYRKFGPVSKRENNVLLTSIDHIPKIIEEVRKLIL